MWVKASGIVLLVASFVSGCAVGTPPASRSEAEQCFQASDQRIHALAWAVDSSSLFVMHGPGWTLEQIDASSHGVIRSIGETLGTGPLASDSDGDALWIADAPDLASVKLFRFDPSAGSTEQWVLPHPRFGRLLWTVEGIRAIEYTMADEGESAPPEALRLVALDLTDDSVSLVPIGPFEPSLTDVGVSVDGSTTAFVRMAGAHSTLSVEGALDGSRTLPGATMPDVWVDGGVVGFLGGDGFYSVWEPRRDRVEQVSRRWAYASSLSPTGRLAVAEMTTEVGPTGRICVTELPPATT